MNVDNQLPELFSRVEFGGEPPMASTAADDLRRGRRHLRRRRAATLGGGAAGVAVLATGVALALPGGPVPSGELGVADSRPPVATASPSPAPAAPPPQDVPDESDGASFPVTRQLLLDTAVEHFDPARAHLPAELNGSTGGGNDTAVQVGTKLSWTIEGEDGMGLVQVAVTNPGYAEAYDYARQDFAAGLRCDLDTDGCTETAIPGTGETAWVAGPSTDTGLVVGVVYERPDGSLVGVAVHDLFGNNSTVPVPDVDISLEQAFAFVTDPDLRVDPDELARGIDIGEPGEAPPPGEGEASDRQ